MDNASETGRRASVEEVPAGYKRTEVGVIPEDWAVRSLQSCLRCAPGYGINAAAVSFDDSLPTYLRITDIAEDGRFRPSPRVSVRHPSATAFFLREGDLVLARTGASVGKSYLYDPKDGPLVFAGFLIRVSPNPLELQPAFLAYYVQSKSYWDWVAAMSIRSGQPGINGREYGTLQLPLPDPEEQRAIAEVLSDVNELIGALGNLIAKKRAIKLAAMQQLLTGKTRLPGFSGEWETKRLGEVLKVCHGRSQQGIVVTDGEYPILASGGEIGRTNTSLHDRPSVLIGRKGTIDEPQFIASPFWTVDTLFYTEIAPDVSATFVFYKFCMIPWRSYNEASGVPSLNARTIESIEMDVPSHDEQAAIAAVLSDMDAEIAALERRRDKTEAIKQGMMQQLLTGRVRLVEPGAVA